MKYEIVSLYFFPVASAAAISDRSHHVPHPGTHSGILLIYPNTWRSQRQKLHRGSEAQSSLIMYLILESSLGQQSWRHEEAWGHHPRALWLQFYQGFSINCSSAFAASASKYSTFPRGTKRQGTLAPQWRALHFKLFLHLQAGTVAPAARSH